MQANTQGQMQWNMQQQAFGRNLELDYLHTIDKSEQAESATIKSSSWLRSKLTAPMLRPQPTTLYPCPFKKAAAMSTSLHYRCPRVIYQPSPLIPQPVKSKQASPAFFGRLEIKRLPQYLLEPLPCKQSITQSMASCLQRVSGNGISNSSIVKVSDNFLLGLRILGLQRNRGGRTSIKASCYRTPSCWQFFISQTCGIVIVFLSSAPSFLSQGLMAFISYIDEPNNCRMGVIL